MSVKRGPASGSDAVISWRYLYVHFASKADIGTHQLNVRCTPEKRTSAELLDHVVGAGEQRCRDRETKGLCCLAIDYELVLGRCLHRKVGRLLAFEDAIDILRRPARLLIHVRPVGH